MSTLDPDQARAFTDALEHLQLAAGAFCYFADDDRRRPAGTFDICWRAIYRAMTQIENAFCRLDRTAYGAWMAQQGPDFEPCDAWDKFADSIPAPFTRPKNTT